MRNCIYGNEIFNVKDLDVIVATPPCQGMSVANHKKKDELKRNSLVVESIKMVSKIQPKFSYSRMSVHFLHPFVQMLMVKIRLLKMQ